MNAPDFGDLSLPNIAPQGKTEEYNPVVGEEPLYKGGYRNDDERYIHTYHARMEARSRVALNCARRLLSHKPKDWPEPETADDVIAMVEKIAATPRKFGTRMWPHEVRAIAFVHAIFKREKINAAKQASGQAAKGTSAAPQGEQKSASAEQKREQASQEVTRDDQSPGVGDQGPA